MFVVFVVATQSDAIAIATARRNVFVCVCFAVGQRSYQTTVDKLPSPIVVYEKEV